MIKRIHRSQLCVVRAASAGREYKNVASAFALTSLFHQKATTLESTVFFNKRGLPGM